MRRDVAADGGDKLAPRAGIVVLRLLEQLDRRLHLRVVFAEKIDRVRGPRDRGGAMTRVVRQRQSRTDACVTGLS